MEANMIHGYSLLEDKRTTACHVAKYITHESVFVFLKKNNNNKKAPPPKKKNNDKKTQQKTNCSSNMEKPKCCW